MKMEDEFKKWLEWYGIKPDSRNTRFHAVRTVDRNLKAIGLPYTALQTAWKVKGGIQNVRKRLQEIRKDARGGGKKFEILMSDSIFPLIVFQTGGVMWVSMGSS